MNITKTIQTVERLRNSNQSNPRWRFHMTDGSTYDTVSNAMFNYEISPYRLDGKDVMVYIGRYGKIEGYEVY